MFDVLKQAEHFVLSECSFAFGPRDQALPSVPITLSLPLDAVWYRGMTTHWSASAKFTSLSSGILEIAHRMTTSRCGSGGPSLAAMLRIARTPTPPQAMELGCTDSLHRLNELASQQIPRQHCAHYISTDWFASADAEGLSSAHETGLNRCWHRTMGVLEASNSSSDSTSQAVVPPRPI